MAQRNVIVEFRHTPDIAESFVLSSRFGASFAAPAMTEVSIPGLTLDPLFPVTIVPKESDPERHDMFLESLSFSAGLSDDTNTTTFIRRGVVDDEQLAAASTMGLDDQVVGIYADPAISPFLTCIDSPAQGTSADVAALLGVPRLQAAGMTGEDVLVAIVDTGISLDHLKKQGLQPKFDAARSWVPKRAAGAPPFVPGQLPVGHGTMCAFDALIAAPKATLIDVAVLQSTTPGATVMEGLLSDALLAYSFLVRVMQGLGGPGQPRSLVVNNSWGMFNAASDFPKGNPGNYSDNPDHPFNRIVGTLERAGADILFAAGNCGRECRDRRCGTEVDAGIYGANSHPSVLSVAGVDIRGERVGYSTRGPGRLDAKKPDVACYTHFKGSGVSSFDGGTSAATPVLAGVVAAVRSKFPSGAEATPAQIRDLVRNTASGGRAGFNVEVGVGVVDGPRLAGVASLAGGPGGGVEERVVVPAPATPRAGGAPTASEFLAAVDAFDENAQPAELRATYEKVRPILAGLLPVIEGIPAYGGKAGAAVRALMGSLDGSVSAGGAEVRGVGGGSAGVSE